MKEARNSNIELLRIISMFFIFCGHLISQSNFFSFFNLNVFNFLSINILADGLRIATNIFLIIGVWFMVDAKFKAKNILKIWGQVAFYSIPITLIVVLLGMYDSLKDVLRGFFPFLGRPLWFASAYMSLYLISPFLKKILKIEHCDRFVLLLLLLVSFVSSLPDIQESYVLDCVWFMIVYLFIGILKQSNIISKLKKHRLYVLLIGIFIYFFLSVSYSLCTIYANKYSILLKFEPVLYQYLFDLKSIPNFLCALCISLYFILSDNKKNNVVNYIASVSFSVYIFHQIPVFKNILWNVILVSNFCKNSNFYVFLIIILFVIIYIIVFIIDILRKKYFENKFLNSKICKKICNKIDNYIGI